MTLLLPECAGPSRSTPAEAERVHPALLVGTWQGIAWQIPAGSRQGEMEITVMFEPGGAWKTTAGGSGTSWLVGGSGLK